VKSTRKAGLTPLFNSLVAFAACLLLPGCLDFGKKKEWLSPNVTQKHLDEIASITGLTLPAGTTGLAYYYDGRGIDAAMAAKLSIPAEKVVEIRAHKIFTKGRNEIPAQGVGTGRAWWKPDVLSDRVNRTMTIKNKQFLGCILGKDGSDYILYVTWFDT
jgi:hypothetical protein